MGNFEKLLLLARARLTEEYGVSIRQQIEERTGKVVSADAVAVIAETSREVAGEGTGGATAAPFTYPLGRRLGVIT